MGQVLLLNFNSGFTRRARYYHYYPYTVTRCDAVQGRALLTNDPSSMSKVEKSRANGKPRPRARKAPTTSYQHEQLWS